MSNLYFIYIVPALTFLFLLNKVSDFDIWTHLSLGRYIYENLSLFPTLKEPLLYPLSDQPLQLQSWLFALVVYVVHLFMGINGLIFFNALIGALAALFLYKAAIASGVRADAAAISVILFLPLLSIRFIIRPEIFLYLSMSIAIYLIAIYTKEGRNRLFLIPPLIALTMNLHPSGLIILILLFFYLLPELLKAASGSDPLSKKRLLTLSIVIPLSLAASAFNPYGIGPLFAPVRLALDAAHSPQPKILLGAGQDAGSAGDEVRTAITEMMPIYEAGEHYFAIYIAYIALLLVSFIPSLIKRGFDLPSFLILLFFASLPLKVTRAIGIFPIVAIPIFARNISYAPRIGFKKVLISGLTILILFKCIHFRDIGLGLKEEMFPVNASDFILRERIEGNMFNPFDTGGYLGWRLYSRHKPFIDGRMASSLLREESMVFDTIGNWKEVLDRYKVDFIVTNSTYLNDGGLFNVIGKLFADNDWILIYQDHNCLIFIRNGTNSHLVEKYRLPKSHIWDEVVSEAKNHILSDPKKERTWETLGYAYSMQGRWKDAAAAYKKGLRYQPENKRLHDNIAVFRSMGYY